MGESRKRKEKKERRGVRLSFSGRYPQLPPLGGDLLARRRGGLQKKKMREEKER